MSSGKSCQVRNIFEDDRHQACREMHSACEPTATESCSLARTKRQHSPVLRSCYNCHNRKIKCDKNEQCASCVRSGKSCTYPSPIPRIRRTKKAIASDMASRINRIEQSLAAAKEQVAQTSTLVSLPHPSSGSVQLESENRDDILVQGGSSSQYIDEVIFSRALGEVRESDLESALTTPNAPAASIPKPSPFDILGILSSPHQSLAPAALHPAKSLANKLWSTYCASVESCTGCKFLHLPTDQVRIYSTIDDPGNAPPENLALCFAVYYISTISIDGAECQNFLGHDKNTLLLRLKLGFEQALAHGDFLNRPTVTELHAFMIYLSALRVHNRGKGLLILSGLAIQIAQLLGLHRDGERLGLPPFEAEIRRRLYWHIISRDSRAGEDYGLEATNASLLSHSVALPRNLHDGDLYPGMQQLPPERKEWTPMLFSILHIQVVRTMQRLKATFMSSSLTWALSEEHRANLMIECRSYIEERLNYCNVIIPQQRFTYVSAQFLLEKLNFVTKVQWNLSRRAHVDKTFPTEESLSQALDILGRRIRDLKNDELLKPFSWILRAYPQYHMILYVLWCLCVIPVGPDVDSAWTFVDDFFADESIDGDRIGFDSKYAVIAALRTKASAVKNKVRETDRCATAASDEHNLGVNIEEHVGFEAMIECFNMDTDDVALGRLDWPSLMQGFQLESSDIF